MHNERESPRDELVPASGESRSEAAVTPATEREAGLLDLVWSWLNSLPAAIWVLVLLAACSVIGTVVPQWNQVEGASEAAYLARYGQGKWWLIKTLSLHRIYSAWYFILLNAWLALSAVVCTSKKLRQAWRAWRSPVVARPAGFYQTGKAHCAGVELAPDTVVQRLRAARFRIRTLEDPAGALYLLGQQGLLRLWALVVLHCSILVILLGALLSWIYGVQGSLAVEPGRPVVMQADPREGKPGWLRSFLSTHVQPREYRFTLNGFRIPLDLLDPPAGAAETPAQAPELAYFERLVVRQYVSDLTVRTGATEKRKRDLSVNWPLAVGGLTVYQSAYNYLLPLHFRYFGRELRAVPITSGMVLAVSSQGVVDARSGVSGRYLVEVLEFKVGEVYEGNRRVDELPPTALLRVAEPDTGESGVFLVDPGHPAEAGGLQISMGGRGEVVGISIFSYKTDPGSSVVYLGTILLTLASLLALWVGYEEVRVRVQEGRSEWRLTRRGLQLRLQERLERIIAGPARPQPPRPWDGAV